MKQLLLLAALPLSLLAQTDAGSVAAVLKAPLTTPDVVTNEIRHHLIAKVPGLPTPASAEAWTREAGRLRERMLKEIVFHGWPADWVNAPPHFEDLGLIPSHDTGYRMRRLRYEIVPGFWSTAILYEPEHLSGKVPAMLNVNGHVGPLGKSVEYKQKRCIEEARMGMLALNLEWLAFGELSNPENEHWNAAHLDLAGANGVGLFYLALRKGIDYLHDHPNTDTSRIGVTGLSGGGWQTIVLSSLDERVKLSTPVAGYSAMRARIERNDDVGDIEQNATDMLTVADYPQLTALRAPRPTLLVFNAEDDCCFRAPLVKPDVYDAIRPVFHLYGADGAFAWHENTDPSNHNYQLDNRMAFYRFAAEQFGLKAPEREAPADLLSYEQTVVGLPAGNLTILGLAKRLAAEHKQGGDLREILRYRPLTMSRAWPIDNSKSKGLETVSYKLDFSDGLSATAVWLRAISAEAHAPATIVLNDAGKAGAGEAVSDRINRGDNVFAVDLFLNGDAAPQKPGPWNYTQMFAALGERPLAIQAAQLTALAAWTRSVSGASEVRLETSGLRTEMTALTATALSPGLFSDAVLRSAAPSLQYVYEKPVTYFDAPEVFCLDLYKYFDVDSLRAKSAPTRVSLFAGK